MNLKILSYSYFLLLHCFLLTSSASPNNPHCSPSSCGHIRNISHPFRLRNDLQTCGSPLFELLCENNTTTSLYLNSTKYTVQAIHYNNYTIRLVDPAITSHICSTPNQSITPKNFSTGYPYDTSTPYNLNNLVRFRAYVPADPDDITLPIIKSITYISCASSLLSSSGFVEISGSVCSYGAERFDANSRKVYVKYGGLLASEMEDMCRIELVTMTSLWFKSGSNLSLSDIHACLEYGFELSWFSALCGGNCSCFIKDTTPTCAPKTIQTMSSSCVWPKKSPLQCDRGLPNWLVVAVNLALTPQFIESISYYGFLFSLALRIIIGIPIFLWFLIYMLRRRRLSMFEVIESFLQSNNNLMPIRYSYSNIRKITRGFREKLGQGGYGTVYKGKLRSGHHVAVKVLNQNHKANGPIDFINEVGTIGRIHHVNVVKLIGYCVEGSKCALIYDYMPNGSLDKHIFGGERVETLSCQRRYEIAIGVARGIEYLHLGCDIQILHFDIKPHNILLDANLTPKISDFGLAKFYATRDSSITFTTPRGTIGYVAPELMNRSIGRVSYKADVYSFGMLLLEMIGLKRDVVDRDKSSQYFPFWIYDKLNKGEDIEMGGNGENKVDEIDEEADEGAMRIIKRMTIVGLWCIQMCPNNRPSMNEVVSMLEDDSADLEIPPHPAHSPFIVQENGQHWTMESSDSIDLLGSDGFKGEQGNRI